MCSGHNATQLVETNDGDSELAQEGVPFMSCNADGVRLWIPDNQRVMLGLLRGAEEVIISQGPFAENPEQEMIQVLWEDRSDTPIRLLLSAELTDRPLRSSGPPWFPFAVWTREGPFQSWPARFQRLPRVPWP